MSQHLSIAPVALSAIRPDPRNVRKGLGDLGALTASIRALGVLQPITVRAVADREGRYTVVMGHRRLAAAKLAGLETIPAHLTECADVTVRQAAENMVRLNLSDYDTWRALARLSAEGYDDTAAELALGLDRRAAGRARLLGRLHPPMLRRMEEENQAPPLKVLGLLAQAPIETQRELWKRLAPKVGERIEWHRFSHALSVSRIARKHALFGDELAARHGVAWTEDLFAAIEDAVHTTSVEGFVAAQAEWLAQTVRELEAAGIEACVVATDEYGEPRMPAGHERAYSPRAEGTMPWDPAWETAAGAIRGLWVTREGEVRAACYRPARPREAQPWDAPRKVGLTPAEKVAVMDGAMKGWLPKDPGQSISAKGLAMIEVAKRDAVAAAALGIDDGCQLVAVLTAMLAQATGKRSSRLEGLFSPDGSGRLAFETAPQGDFAWQEHAIEAACQLVSANMEKHSQFGRGFTLELVERIGSAIGACAVWEPSAEELATLKKPAITVLGNNLGVTFGATQKATREAIMRTGALGRLRLGPDQLPLLGWKVEPVAAGSTPDLEDDDPSQDFGPTSDDHDDEADDAGALESVYGPDDAHHEDLTVS